MTIELDYDAMTVDSSSFANNGYALERGWLAQLNQFAASPVELLISEIVHNELKGHLAKRVQETRQHVAKGLRSAASELQVSEATIKHVSDLLSVDGADESVASARLERFYEKTKAKIVPAASADMDSVVRLYFSGKPPFKSTGDKKAEFPDAIALVGLDLWAAARNQRVLVVSSDAGWMEFCETSQQLDCVKELKDALTHFQPHNTAIRLVEEIQEELLIIPTESKLHSSIIRALDDSVSEMTLDAQADSYYMLEERYSSVTYTDHEFTGEANIISVVAGRVVIQLGATIKCEVVAQFDLYRRDPVDRDDVKYGREKVSQEAAFDTDLLLTLVGNFSKGLSGVELQKIEMTKTEIGVDFGEIELHWERGEGDF